LWPLACSGSTFVLGRSARPRVGANGAEPCTKPAPWLASANAREEPRCTSDAVMLVSKAYEQTAPQLWLGLLTNLLHGTPPSDFTERVKETASFSGMLVNTTNCSGRNP
jgi:hypothetical protein